MKYILFRLLSLIRPNERPSDYELISYGYHKAIEEIRAGRLTVFPIACTPDYPAYLPAEQERNTDPHQFQVQRPFETFVRAKQSGDGPHTAMTKAIGHVRREP